MRKFFRVVTRIAFVIVALPFMLLGIVFELIRCGFGAGRKVTEQFIAWI